MSVFNFFSQYYIRLDCFQYDLICFIIYFLGLHILCYVRFHYITFLVMQSGISFLLAFFLNNNQVERGLLWFDQSIVGLVWVEYGRFGFCQSVSDHHQKYRCGVLLLRRQREKQILGAASQQRLPRAWATTSLRRGNFDGSYLRNQGRYRHSDNGYVHQGSISIK